MLDGSMFVVCPKCGAHEVKRKRVDNIELCGICGKKQVEEKRLQKRRDAHKDIRTSISSHVPIKFLSATEASERNAKCKARRDAQAAKIKVGFRPGLKAGVAAKSSKAKKADCRVETKKKSGSRNGKTPVKVTPEQRDLLTETSIGQPKKKTKTKHTKEINECAIMDKSKTGGRDGEELTMDTVNLM